MDVDEAETSSNKSNTVVQIALEEYRSLRAEINQRLAIQATIATLAPVIVGIAVAANFDGDHELLVLAASLISLLLAFLHLAQDINLAIAGTYIGQELRSTLLKGGQINSDQPSSVFSWEQYRIKKLYDEGWRKVIIRAVSAVGSIVLVAPAVVALAYYSGKNIWNGLGGDLELIPAVMTVIGWVLVAVFAVVSRQLVKQYGEIPNDSDKTSKGGEEAAHPNPRA